MASPVGSSIPSLSPVLLNKAQSNASLASESVRRRTAKIGVLGLGHVGLPTALSFCEAGWHVVGADSSASVVDTLRLGKVPFYEAGLPELLEKHLGKRFHVTHDVGAAIREATVVFVCVGTPQKETGEADLSQVEAVARCIAANLNGYKLVVGKSTVPAITAQWVKRTIQRYSRNGHKVSQGSSVGVPEFDVASSPEFLRQGVALENLLHPDRIVCGVESETAQEILEQIYKPLAAPLLITKTSTAELIKHAANSFLAMKISFINMVADLCEAVGADIDQVAAGIGMDPRIGPDFLQAGIGFGGYCFPKDLRAFLRLAEEYDLDLPLLRAVIRINEQRIELFLKKVRRALWVVQGKKIAVLGLSFKPRTDDTRESPSLKIVHALVHEGAILRLHDPQAIPNVSANFPPQEGSLSYCEDAYSAAHQAHALLLLTDWPEYRKLDLKRIRELMEVPVVVDGRNVFRPAEMEQLGFEYYSIGR